MSSDKYEWQIGSAPPPLEEHSIAKHAVFRSYVRRYIDVLTSDPRHDALSLTLIDGFAGGGAYTYQGGTSPGSPMILLQEVSAAQAHFDASRTKPFALKAEFIFIENRRPNYEYLKQEIQKSPFGARLDRDIRMMGDDFQTALPKVIEHIKKRGRAHRSIFFLDQYGYSDVSFAAVRSILSELENPEIIITFNVDFLIDYLNEDISFLKAVTPVELDLRQIQEMLTMKGTGREARWAIQNFLYNHLMKSTGAPFYTCFFVKSPASHRSYWLIHISKHPKARDEMAARHWAMSNHFIHQGHAGLRMLGFDPERDIEQIPLDFMFDDAAEARSKRSLLTELPPLIFSADIMGRDPPTLEKLFIQICNETPATRGLVSDVLGDLRAAKEIEITTKDGKPRPRSLQLEWSDVIRPARQRLMFSTLWPRPGQ